MGVKGCVCREEHQVMRGNVESLCRTPKTNRMLYVKSRQLGLRALSSIQNSAVVQGCLLVAIEMLVGGLDTVPLEQRIDVYRDWWIRLISEWSMVGWLSVTILHCGGSIEAFLIPSGTNSPGFPPPPQLLWCVSFTEFFLFPSHFRRGTVLPILIRLTIFPT